MSTRELLASWDSVTAHLRQQLEEAVRVSGDSAEVRSQLDRVGFWGAYSLCQLAPPHADLGIQLIVSPAGRGEHLEVRL